MLGAQPSLEAALRAQDPPSEPGPAWELGDDTGRLWSSVGPNREDGPHADRVPGPRAGVEAACMVLEPRREPSGFPGCPLSSSRRSRDRWGGWLGMGVSKQHSARRWCPVLESTHMPHSPARPDAAALRTPSFRSVPEEEKATVWCHPLTAYVGEQHCPEERRAQPQAECTQLFPPASW